MQDSKGNILALQRKKLVPKNFSNFKLHKSFFISRYLGKPYYREILVLLRISVKSRIREKALQKKDQCTK